MLILGLQAHRILSIDIVRKHTEKQHDFVSTKNRNDLFCARLRCEDKNQSEESHPREYFTKFKGIVKNKSAEVNLCYSLTPYVHKLCIQWLGRLGRLFEPEFLSFPC